jgi:hypothetical protein
LFNLSFKTAQRLAKGQVQSTRQRLVELAKKKVVAKVGITGSKANRDGESNQNARIGAAHEFGVGVPRRPFVRPPMVINAPTYQEAIRIAYASTAKRGVAAFEKQMQLLAVKAAADMRAYVRDSANFKSLKRATKKRKGSSKPLIDTGQLVRSIDGVVVRGRGR